MVMARMFPALCFACLLGLGCGRGTPEAVVAVLEPGPPPAAAGSRPDILLISIDTLRADHLGAYGYARSTSPFLNRLAAGSALFERAYAHASWTPPSVASLFTSLYPPQHGSLGKDNLILDDRNQTLAETLGAAGYYAAAYSASPFIHPDFGFGQGFRRFGFEPSDQAGRLAALVERELPALRRAYPRAPLFVYVMFFDPHFPYAPPPPYDSRFNADGGRPSFDPRRVTRVGSLFALGATVGRDTFEYLRAEYDGEIACADAALAELLARFERGELGLDPARTVLVLTADHGEEFLEHAGFGHGNALYEESIRVPLLIREPGRSEGARIPSVVRQVDVFPTLLELAGLQPRPGLEGRSLVGLLDGVPEPDRPAFASFLHLFHQGESQRSLRQGDLKLIVVRNPDRAELYDLRRDPEESHNLAGERPEALARMAVELDALERRLRPVAAPAAGGAGGSRSSERSLDLLRSLGYIQK